MSAPKIPDEDLIAEAVFAPAPPVLIGDVGQDDVFATETHPEGLRYGETPHVAGSLEHGKAKPKRSPPDGDISIG